MDPCAKIILYNLQCIMVLLQYPEIHSVTLTFLLLQYPDIQCDEWCNADHGPSKCPVEYDASDLAKIRGLHKVTEVIDQLNKGQRKPGDGLSSQQGLDTENKISMVENQKKTRVMLLIVICNELTITFHLTW